ncbi:Uncharacterised protein [Mycobacteroides abscessus subsp. abscessus]|nr:Uncharacterised protein [Mycobacteroides abscessus subsp. abscessus]
MRRRRLDEHVIRPENVSVRPQNEEEVGVVGNRNALVRLVTIGLEELLQILATPPRGGEGGHVIPDGESGGTDQHVHFMFDTICCQQSLLGDPLDRFGHQCHIGTVEGFEIGIGERGPLASESVVGQQLFPSHRIVDLGTHPRPNPVCQRHRYGFGIFGIKLENGIRNVCGAEIDGVPNGLGHARESEQCPPEPVVSPVRFGPHVDRCALKHRQMTHLWRDLRNHL